MATKEVIISEVHWRSFHIKIQDTSFVSIKNFCALEEHDQLVHPTFDTLPTYVL
jgi:hypothetical protein